MNFIFKDNQLKEHYFVDDLEGITKNNNGEITDEQIIDAINKYSDIVVGKAYNSELVLYTNGINYSLMNELCNKLKDFGLLYVKYFHLEQNRFEEMNLDYSTFVKWIEREANVRKR